MAKRKKRSGDFEDLQVKGIGCLIVGLVLLFIPVLGGALRPLAWILILLGAALIALKTLIASTRKQQDETNPSTEARQVSQAQSPIKKTRRSRETFGRVDNDLGRRSPSARVEPSFTNTDAVLVRATTWSLNVFEAIEWRRFEAVCEALFAQAGFRTESQSHGADGGVDIWLYSKHATGPAAIVQCKHWKNQAVGVKKLREFFGGDGLPQISQRDLRHHVNLHPGRASIRKGQRDQYDGRPTSAQANCDSNARAAKATARCGF